MPSTHARTPARTVGDTNKRPLLPFFFSLFVLLLLLGRLLVVVDMDVVVNHDPFIVIVIVLVLVLVRAEPELSRPGSPG